MNFNLDRNRNLIKNAMITITDRDLNASTDTSDLKILSAILLFFYLKRDPFPYKVLKHILKICYALKNERNTLLLTNK